MQRALLVAHLSQLRVLGLLATPFIFPQKHVPCACTHCYYVFTAAAIVSRVLLACALSRLNELCPCDHFASEVQAERSETS